MTRFAAWSLIAALIAGAPSPALAYLKFGVAVGSDVVDIKWTGTIPYFVAENSVPGVSASQLRETIVRAFATWQSVETAAIRSQFQGVTMAAPGDADGRTTFGFLDRPDLESVLGATSFLLNDSTGEVLEADVFFNSHFAWSIAPSGEAGRIDLESVALHEIGHLLGLGHSALGETEVSGNGRRVLATGAVMFPIALRAGAIADRQLQPDDRAGISDLYPGAQFETTTSSISGKVTKDGSGVVGAHVTAFNLESGELVGGFTLNRQGDYVIAGLTPGIYVLRAEPLDDADTESFFSGVIDIDFGVAYASRVVIAPRGGGATPMDIQVRPK